MLLQKETPHWQGDYLITPRFSLAAPLRSFNAHVHTGLAGPYYLAQNVVKLFLYFYGVSSYVISTI